MAKLYTRKGDDGFTGILGPGRYPKDHHQLEALGTLDEANAIMGICRNLCIDPDSAQIILHIQRDLYGLLGEVAANSEYGSNFLFITDKHVTWLENQTDKIHSETPMPTDFIVPGDNQSGAYLDLARTVVRRAERRVAALFHQKILNNTEILRYLNRLSSLCFAMELREIHVSGKEQPTIAKNVKILDD